MSEGSTWRERIKQDRKPTAWAEKSLQKKALWREFFAGKAMTQMNTPVCIFPGPLGTLEFVMPPLMLGKKPLLALIGGFFLEPKSAAAAATSIDKASNETDTKMVLDALTAKRRIYIGTTGGKNYVKGGTSMVYVEKKSVFSKKGNEYMNKEGFETLETNSAETDVIVKIFTKIMDACMYAVHDIVYDSIGVSFSDGGNAFDVTQTAYQLALRFIGTALINKQTEELDLDSLLVLCCKPSEHQDLIPAFFTSLKTTSPHIITGDHDKLLNQTGGVTTPMPSDRGWGYMTPIVSENQRKLRGEEAMSIGSLVKLPFLELGDGVHENIDKACKAAQRYIDGASPGDCAGELMEAAVWLHDTADRYMSQAVGTSIDALTSDAGGIDASAQKSLFDSMLREYDISGPQSELNSIIQSERQLSYINALKNGRTVGKYEIAMMDARGVRPS